MKMLGSWLEEEKGALQEGGLSEPPGQTVLVQAMDTELEKVAGIQLTTDVTC